MLDGNKNSRHEHSNKTILDNISQTSIDKWDSAFSHISDTKKHVNSDENGNVNISGFINAIGGFKQNGISLDNRYFQTFEVPSNFNLDTITQQGIYTTINNDTAKTVIRRPSDYAFSIIALSNTQGIKKFVPHIQIANIHNSDSIKVRRRNYDTDTWGDWFEIITDKNKSQFIDDTYTFTTSELVLTSEWQDTGLVYRNIGMTNGTYIIQVIADTVRGGSLDAKLWDVYMSGVIAINTTITNFNELYEIPMSICSHSTGNCNLKFATRLNMRNDSVPFAKLQVKYEGTAETYPVIMTFKFRKMI